MHIKKLSLNNREIEYFETGKGKETLVFLPGVGSNCRIWGKVTPELQDRYKIYSFSLPPYGSTDSSGEAFTIHTLHELVEQYFQELNITQPIFVGYSLGGLVALHYTHHFPQKVKKLILVSTPVKPQHIPLPTHLQLAFEVAKSTKKLQQTIDQKVLTPATRKTVESILYTCFHNPKARQHIELSFQMTQDKGLYNVTTCFEDLFHTDIEKDFETNLPPTLFIYGNKDPLLTTLHSPETILKHQETITISRLDTDHGVLQNKPLETASLIHEFI